jgi:Glycosyl hydrolases family 16/Putative Ig domain
LDWRVIFDEKKIHFKNEFHVTSATASGYLGMSTVACGKNPSADDDLISKDFRKLRRIGFMASVYGLSVLPMFAQTITPHTHPDRWAITFDDQFNGTELDTTKWHAPTTDRQGGSSRWDSNKVKVENSLLKLGITKVTDSSGVIIRYDTGAVSTRVNFTDNYLFRQKYGYYEACYKLPANIDKDYWASFWIMAGQVAYIDPVTGVETNTSKAQEIDILESFTIPRATHTANFHWGGYGNYHNKVSVPLNSPTENWAKNELLRSPGQFHVFGFYWDKDVYVFYLNGTEIGRTNMVGIGDNVTKPNPPNPTTYPTFLAQGTAQVSGNLLLSCEAAPWAGRGGWETNAPDQDEFQIDYVRAYDMKPQFASDPIIGAHAAESAAYQGSLAGTATDASGGVLTFAKVGTEPAWLSVASDGALTGTPSSSDVGVNSFQVSVSDGISTVQSTLKIRVRSFFDQWASNDSLTFSGDGNDDDIPDGLAWLLGSSAPGEKANGRLPTPQRSAEGGLVVNFRSLKASKRGAAGLSLQFSRDLGQTDPWKNVTIPESSATDPVTGVIFSITANGDFNDVQATIPANAAGEAGKLFSRLVAIAQP